MRVVVFCVLLLMCQVDNAVIKQNVPLGLSERVGNFSFEFLERAIASKPTENFLVSPFTVWSTLAVIAEGAAKETLKEVCNVIRINPLQRTHVRESFRNIQQYLTVNTSTVELEKINILFVDRKVAPMEKFVHIAGDYNVTFAQANFNDPHTADILNQAIKTFTKDRISSIVNKDDLLESHMVLTSAVYFKGQWALFFNKSSTSKRPFYDSHGQKIGEVNMMYNRHIFAYANIEPLKARVLELPYGKENRLSMLVLLPYPNVTVLEMFGHLRHFTLDSIFKELDNAMKDFPEDETDVFIPRFKTETSLDLTSVLKDMGIKDLFDEFKANLENMVATPTYVSKVGHKAEIEITEEGTTASGATTAMFSNRIGVTRFEANKPFGYLIVEKTTNTVAFAGSYQVPTLF